MIVLALDPGPERTGLALLSLETRGAGALHVRLEHGEHCGTENILPWLDHQLQHGMRLDLVAVERPGQVRGTGPEVDERCFREEVAKVKSIGASLNATAWHGGGLAYVARYMGLTVRITTAEMWRYALCSARSPSNAQIADALRLFNISGLSRTNNHVRDAIGLGLMVALKPNVGEGMR